MIDITSTSDLTLDTDGVQIALAEYDSFRESEKYTEAYKWDRLRSLNEIFEERGISAESVGDLAEQLEEHNQDNGPLADWRGVADLKHFCDTAPDHAAEELETLFHGDDALNERIDRFREAMKPHTEGQLNAGSSLIGYLFAAYDMDSYAPYRHSVVTMFLDYFSIPSPPQNHGSVGKKYELFCDLCDSLRKIIHEERIVTDATRLDAQDFIYCTVSGVNEEGQQNFMVKRLWRFTRQLDQLKNDRNELLDGIQGLPDTYLQDYADKHTDAGKVNKIRYSVVSRLLSDEDVAVDEIKASVNAEYDTNITQSFTDFTILGPIYFEFYKRQLNHFVDEIAEYLIGEQTSNFDLTHHDIVFQDSRNYLKPRCWFVIYPEREGNHRDAFQLYVNIKLGVLEYGLNAGSDIPHRDQYVDQERVSEEGHISINDIRGKFDTIGGRFDDLNANGQVRRPDKPEQADDIARQLDQVGQVVFYGPPGTGKTYAAKRFADWWIDKGTAAAEPTTQVRVVTFHPSFSYEDFLEGLSAEATDSGAVDYDVKPGRFKRICEDAEEAYENTVDGETPPRFVLIIDEINRGNLAQIFGETITQLEADKRLNEANEVQVQLAHSGDQFVVPPNLFVIGTMNTADRSIALVDAALRRRFRFINFPPDYDVLYKEYDFADKDDVKATAALGEAPRALLALSILAVEELNERIRRLPDLGKGKQIGHSYLFGCTQNNERIDKHVLVDTWKYEILPLLEEYYFGQFKRIEQDLLAGTDDRLVDWSSKQIKDFNTDDLRMALSSIVDIEPPAGSSETGLRRTVDILSENGVLEAGDILEFNRERVRKGTTVSDADVDQAEDERNDTFWQSKVIDDTAETGKIRWLSDGELYTLSGAARNIFEEITNGDETGTGQPDHWCHPDFNNRELYQLRDDGVDGTERTASTE
jgi:5-methylcytosine-specific restriction protein B